MGRLVYASIGSLDGFIADTEGSFEWSAARTRLEPQFDPDIVRQLVDRAEGKVSIGGPELAAHALRAGLVETVEYYANPVILGSGKHWLPGDLRLDLRLVELHRFTCGVVHLAYEVAR